MHTSELLVDGTLLQAAAGPLHALFLLATVVELVYQQQKRERGSSRAGGGGSSGGNGGGSASGSADSLPLGHFSARLQMIAGTFATISQVLGIRRLHDPSRGREAGDLALQVTMVLALLVPLVLVPLLAPRWYERKRTSVCLLARLAWLAHPNQRNARGIAHVLQAPPVPGRHGLAKDVLRLFLAVRGISLLLLVVTMPLPLWLHVLASTYAVQRVRTTADLCGTAMLRAPAWVQRIAASHAAARGLPLLLERSALPSFAGCPEEAHCRLPCGGMVVAVRTDAERGRPSGTLITSLCSPACIARPPPAQEPTAVPAQALSVACPGQGSAQHQCCQSPADGPGDAQQQQPRPCAAAAQGAAQCGGDVSRRNAGAAAPPSWAQQLPGSGPPTPEAACEAESVSGELRHRAAEQPGHAPGATAAAAAVCAADALSDDPAGDLLMLRRLQSFVHCVAGSPLVQSALLFLEHVGEHPSALPASQAAAGPAGRASAAGLEWTLSQLLALWLRAGYTHACESALLGALWVLESSHNAWRSSAAVCLASYTKLIGACAPEVVKRLTADWPAAFTKLRHALVQAQMELLQRTGWRVRLDLAADVLPCHALLFCPALVGGNQLQLGLPPALALPPAVAAMQEWAPTMRRLCAVIREKSRRLKAHEQATEAARVQATEAARVPTPECEDEGERPAKRPRPDSNP